MDQFKKYLREHRDELDVEIPLPSQMWQQKPVKKSIRTSAIRWMAAASVAIFVSCILYWSLDRSGDHGASDEIVKRDTHLIQQQSDSVRNDLSEVAENSDEKTEQDTTIQGSESKRKIAKKQTYETPKGSRKTRLKSSPLQSLETNYATIIDYQLERLEQTPIYAESADYFHVFKKQWYDLESDEEKIKRDMQSYGLNDIMVAQFIQLYQNKIGLLKQLQTEIDKMNLRARRHPGFVNQTPTYLKM
jgi:hypothetical protein